MFNWHQMTALNLGKSGGPDGCYPHVLQKVKEGVVTPLHLIFQKSLEDDKCQLPGKMHH